MNGAWEWRLAKAKKIRLGRKMSFGLIRFVLPGFISLRRGSLPRWVRLAAPAALRGRLAKAKKNPALEPDFLKTGGAKGSRTLDLNVANVAL